MLKRFFVFFIVIVCAFQTVDAATTTGGVNWLDSLGYAKPKFIPINIPPSTNVYWVDMTSGSGTTCSEASPCLFAGLSGLTGTNGGPAWIRVKGSGQLNDNITLQGTGDALCWQAACDNWIYVTTWPAGSTGCATECTATFSHSGNIDSWNHIIFDGGADLKFQFVNSGNNNQYAQHIQGTSYIIVYRTQTYTENTDGATGWAIGDFSNQDNTAFINNEFHTGDLGSAVQTSAVYFGPGTGGGFSNFYFLNNIARQWSGECIEVNPRINSSNLVITGNAMHTCGYDTCTLGFNCRPAIVLAVQSGSGTDGVLITNNLMWDMSSGCIWDRNGGTFGPPLIYNNTCYDYGKGTGGAGDPNPEGISGFSDGGTATIKNNIIYAPNGTDPLDGSPFTATNNACGSGKSCGSSSIVFTPP